MTLQENRSLRNNSGTLRTRKIVFLVEMVILVLCAVLFLVSVELAGRWYAAYTVRNMPVDFENTQANHLHQYDSQLGWFMRANAHVFLPYEVNTNSLGIRNRELQPPKGQTRILAIGDSRTFGDGVSDEHTWPYLLEQELNALQPGRFEVINAGVCGWNSFQGLRFLETRGLALEPHMVICAFGANDWARVHPGESGWIYWDDLRNRWGTEVLVRESIKGCASMIDAEPFGPREYRMSPGEYTDTLVRVKEICQQQGVELWVLHLPKKNEVGANPDLEYAFKTKWLSQGVAKYTFSTFIDATEFFLHPSEAHYVDPMHFSVSGNAVIAGGLSEKIMETLPR